MSRPPVNPTDGSAPADDRGSSGQGSHAGTPADRPVGVVVIALIVAAEALALLAAAVFYGYQLATGVPVMSFAGALFMLVLLLAFSAWLFAVGHFLFRGYRWPRAGALVAQVFALTLGFPALTAGQWVAGLALLVPAVTAAVLLFSKPVIDFTSRQGGTPSAL